MEFLTGGESSLWIVARKGERFSGFMPAFDRKLKPFLDRLLSLSPETFDWQVAVAYYNHGTGKLLGAPLIGSWSRSDVVDAISAFGVELMEIVEEITDSSIMFPVINSALSAILDTEIKAILPDLTVESFLYRPGLTANVFNVGDKRYAGFAAPYLTSSQGAEKVEREVAKELDIELEPGKFLLNEGVLALYCFDNSSGVFRPVERMPFRFTGLSGERELAKRQFAESFGKSLADKVVGLMDEVAIISLTIPESCDA